MSRTAAQLPPAGVALRWARAVAVALTAWCTAGAAHVLGGGDLPPVAVIAATVVISAWPMTFGLGGPASGRRLVGLLGAGQATMHTVFVVSAAWVAQPPSPAAGRMPGMSMGSGHPHGTAGSSGLPAGDPAHLMPVMPGPAMLATHVAAAVLLGYVLADADRVLFSLLGLLQELTRPVLRLCRRVTAALTAGPPVPGLAGTVVIARSRDAQLWRDLVLRPVTRRGPPVDRALCA